MDYWLTISYPRSVPLDHDQGLLGSIVELEYTVMCAINAGVAITQMGSI